MLFDGFAVVFEVEVVLGIAVKVVLRFEVGVGFEVEVEVPIWTPAKRLAAVLAPGSLFLFPSLDLTHLLCTVIIFAQLSHRLDDIRSSMAFFHNPTTKLAD